MKDLKITKSKFFKLDILQRHKKCSKILKDIYLLILEKKDKKIIEELFSYYNELTSWMELEKFYTLSLKEISDKYHFHLKNSDINLKEHNLLPSIRTGDRQAKEIFPSTCIYLDNIRSAYNVGSIIRTTEALRIGNIYFSDKTPFIDNKKVIKTSMGSSEIVPCYKNSINDLPRPFIALETAYNAISLFDFIFPENFTLILGNEEYGISENILKKVDYIVEIPMLGCKNSINVACAFAIIASFIKKQKNILKK